jgi:hypothetical protein
MNYKAVEDSKRGKEASRSWKRPVHVPPSHPTPSCLRVSTVGSSRGIGEFLRGHQGRGTECVLLEYSLRLSTTLFKIYDYLLAQHV